MCTDAIGVALLGTWTNTLRTTANTRTFCHVTPYPLFSERSIKTIMRVGSRTTYWIYIQWIELVIQVSHWLSFSLIWLVDLDFNLRSYRTDDYVPRLFFESSRAQNFNETWVVKLSISSVDHSPTNPTALLNRSISFQLIMKSRPSQPKEIHFMVVRAPGSDFQVWLHVNRLDKGRCENRPILKSLWELYQRTTAKWPLMTFLFKLNHMTYMHRFTADNLETPYFTLPLSSPAEVNRMIGSRNFYLRVYFFQHHQHEDREGGRDSRDQRSSQGGWNWWN